MNEYNEVFCTVLLEILERLAFLFGEAEKPEELGANPPGEILQAGIAFTGPVQGTIHVATDSAICAELAANVMGCEAGEVNQQLASDALGELVNILCGDFFPRLFGTQALFHLTIPDVREIDARTWREMAASGEVVAMMVEEHPLLAVCTIQDEQAQTPSP